MLTIIIIIIIIYSFYKMNYIYSSLMNNNEEYYYLLVPTAKILSGIYNTIVPEDNIVKNKKTKNKHYIPKIIWQTYKTKDLPYSAIDAHKSWVTKNVDWEVKIYDDNDIEKYIIEYWGSRTLTFYKNLTIGAMKADLWRYLIMSTHGGVYSDIDNLCTRSINSWIYENKLYDKKDILLISLEPNELYFCQWIFLSTPNHPAMRHVCEYILLNYEKNGINKSDPNFVFNTTGPAIWTKAIKNYLQLDDYSVKQIYANYLNNKESFENKYIYILPYYTFSIIYSITLIGSHMFKDNYQSWKVEQRKMNLIN